MAILSKETKGEREVEAKGCTDKWEKREEEEG